MYGSLYFFASPVLRNGGLIDYVSKEHEKYSMDIYDYISTFMFGVRNVNNGCSRLSRLGEEALLDFQIEVAEYVGVRFGKKWHVVQNASKRLMLNITTRHHRSHN